MADTSTPKAPDFDLKSGWLTELLGKLDLGKANRDDLDRREQGMALIRGLDAEKGRIRDTLAGIKVTTRDGETLSLLDKGGDQDNEVDTVHHVSQMTRALSSEQMTAITREMDKIYRVEAELKKNPYYHVPPPTFPEAPKTDDLDEKARILALREHKAACDKIEADYRAARDIADKHLSEDLWEPLMREGVIPENFIPQDYSPVARLFSGAADAYDQRIRDYSAQLSDKGALQEKFAKGFKAGRGILKFAGGVAGYRQALGEAVVDEGMIEGAKDAKDFFGHFETALGIGEGLANAKLTDGDYTAVGMTLVEKLAPGVSKIKGLDSLAAKMITTVATLGVRAVSVRKKLAAGEYGGAFLDLGGAISGELARYDPVENGLMTLIGINIETQIKSAVSGGKVGRMIAEGASPQAILLEITNAAVTIGETAVTNIRHDLVGQMNEALGKGPRDPVKDPPEEEEPLPEGEDYDPLNQDWMDGGTVEKARFDLAALRKRSEEVDRLMADKMKATQEERRAAEREDLARHLRMGFPLATDDEEAINQAETERMASIEYILALQKKADATTKMARMVSDKGGAFLARIFPPAGMVTSLVTLAGSLKDAYETTTELATWTENLEDAMTARSSQVDAFLNRMGLQTHRTLIQGSKVLLDASRVVGQVLKTLAADPGGLVIEASANLVDGAIELADLIYTESELSKAWAVYQQARKVPQDRFLARKAMRDNPTLAKYAMAYGALNGDPVAVEGMRRCGLDRQTLAVPGTNVAKVVTYLEAKFADDPVLLRAAPVPEKWYPGPVELTAVSFIGFYRMATTKAEPRLETSGDISGMTAALGRVVTAETAFRKALTAAEEAAKRVTKAEAAQTPVILDEVAQLTLESALVQARSQALAYRPRTPDAAPHREMATYVDALAALAETRLAEVERLVRDAPWSAQYLP